MSNYPSDGWHVREVYFENGDPTMHRDPPTEREWQSLTDEEITILSLVNRNAHGALTVPEFARAIEAAVRAKNT